MKKIMITAAMLAAAISGASCAPRTALTTDVGDGSHATYTADTTKAAADTTTVDTADVANDTITTNVAATVDTANINAAATAAATRAGYLFSVRPEFAIVHDDISSIGGVIEIGNVFENGLYTSLDFGGGEHYMGGGLNVGYMFGSRGAGLKSVIGYSLGYYHTDIVVNFESENTGELLKRFVGKNVGVTGIFFKLAGGNKHLVDFTGRVMTGYKSGSVWYSDKDGISTEDDFTASYSMSVGYTFVKRRDRK